MEKLHWIRQWFRKGEISEQNILLAHEGKVLQMFGIITGESPGALTIAGRSTKTNSGPSF